MSRFFQGGFTPAKRRTVGWGLVVLVWVPMLALIIWGSGGVLDLLQLRREVSDLQDQIETLKKENESLREEVRRLQTDATAYEGPAREMLLRKKKGEVVLYLPLPGTAPVKPPSPANAPPPVNAPVNAAAQRAPLPEAPQVPPPTEAPASAPEVAEVPAER